jgi:hypothetical protein
MDDRLPGWSPDGTTWYTHEGGVQVSYTTAGLSEANVVQDSVTQTVATGLVPPTVEFPPFQDFQKIPRLFRDCVVTEKIDGTNASIVITEDGQIRAGSRTRYIFPDKPKEPGKKREVTDNYGFAAWVEEHKTALLSLGKGRHFGEWYGKGINRNYGLEEKRFALFNTSVSRDTLPSCVGVVPVLYTGSFDLDAIRTCMHLLRTGGSVAVPGFMNPEGVVVFHVAAGKLFKATLQNDEKPKGAA